MAVIHLSEVEKVGKKIHSDISASVFPSYLISGSVCIALVYCFLTPLHFSAPPENSTKHKTKKNDMDENLSVDRENKPKDSSVYMSH